MPSKLLQFLNTLWKCRVGQLVLISWKLKECIFFYHPNITCLKERAASIDADDDVFGDCCSICFDCCYIFKQAMPTYTYSPCSNINLDWIPRNAWEFYRCTWAMNHAWQEYAYYSSKKKEKKRSPRNLYLLKHMPGSSMYFLCLGIVFLMCFFHFSFCQPLFFIEVSGAQPVLNYSNTKLHSYQWNELISSALNTDVVCTWRNLAAGFDDPKKWLFCELLLVFWILFQWSDNVLWDFE